MRGLQICVTLVQRIATPVVVERANLESDVFAHTTCAAAILVEVVAKECDQIEVFLGHVAECGEVALLPVLAG